MKQQLSRKTHSAQRGVLSQILPRLNIAQFRPGDTYTHCNKTLFISFSLNSTLANSVVAVTYNKPS